MIAILFCWLVDTVRG